MHAKISDRERRAGDFDSISRDSILGRGEWQPEDLWAREAEREARAILAETEPRGGCGPFDPASWYEVRLEQSGAVAGPLCALPALAESLRSFVEA